MSLAQQAIELVRAINDPKNVNQVPQLSQQLQQIQSSLQGWEVADGMLADDDPRVRFYGAHTLTVKLNTQAATLNNEAAVEIKSRLLSWFVRLTCRNDKTFVLEKLCTTLATYFIQSPVPWQRAVRQVVCSLQAEEAVSAPIFDKHASTAIVLARLTPLKVSMVLRFCRVLAEDVRNKANAGAQHHHLEVLLKVDASDAAEVMRYVYTLLDVGTTDIVVEALGCFAAWVNYAHLNWQGDPETMNLLQQLTPFVLNHLQSDNDDIRNCSVDVVVEILEYHLKFLTKDQLAATSQTVRDRIGPQCVQRIQAGENDDDTLLSYVKLVSAYARAIINQIIYTRSQSSSGKVVEIMQQLICSPGHAIDDDEVLEPATEFWMEYAEFAVDAAIDSSEDDLPWLSAVRDDLIGAAQSYMPKLRVPPTLITQKSNAESVEKWKFFRDNIADFLESITSLPGTHLVRDFVHLAMNILPSRQWVDLEAVLFCLNSIAESAVMNDEEREALSALIGSSLFIDVSNDNSSVPASTKRTLMRFIDGYSSFVKKHPAYIPPILTYLFTTLETTPLDQAKLTDAAAKSFSSLSSSCRSALTEHLHELLQQCPRALSGPSANAYQKEKIMAALASIIQALPTEEAKAGPLLTLIEVIERDLNAAVEYIQRGDPENGEILGTTGLQCLASIGKGIQAPDDVTVDLEDGDESRPQRVQYLWSAAEGSMVQQRILACFNIVDHLQSQGDAIDAACSVLRSGLTETEPGPFVFPPSAVVNFVQKAQLTTPRIESIVTTACSFVSAYSRGTSPHLYDEVFAIHQTIARVMLDLQNPVNDPQLAQLCIDFLHRLLASYLDVLLAPNDDEITAVLNFTIECLVGEAPMLKRNASNFFETLLGLANPRSPLPQPETRIPLSNVITAFTPSLARALVYNITGAAQRSELDSLCKPLRALIFALTQQARSALEAALGEAQMVEDKEKREFMVKIMALRGNRQTNTVVKEFWARCKGTVSSFG